MKAWWIRPGVRLLAAALLPLAVPLVITLFIWALPGDPAEIICPPEQCGGTAELAARWNLDRGAWGFYTSWIGDALQGEFGRSWRVHTGEPLARMLAESIPSTLKLLAIAAGLMVLGAVGAASNLLPRRLDPVFSAVGLVPAVVLALVAAAQVELAYGADSFGEEGELRRLVYGALVLGLADGAFSSAVTGVRGLFAAERVQRYVGIALLRGEAVLPNMLPNVMPALVGQLRARLLHLLSGTVVVEVVVGVNGVGDLLWRGTLLQDFGVVLGAASAFAVVSAALLGLQALTEVAVALHVRRAPEGVAQAVRA